MADFVSHHLFGLSLIHIYLARWFLEGDPVDSFTTGDAYVCTGLADYNDYDNGFSLTKFEDVYKRQVLFISTGCGTDAG